MGRNLTFRKVEMGTYREYIEKMKSEWIGKKITFEGKKYNVVGVDYNGMLLIDRKSRYTETTAVSITSVSWGVH